jgi:glycosyltransferase involved in cell wall biosynthesis
MRIAITSRTNRHVGGVEMYLGDLLPALTQLEHEVAFLCETDLPTHREALVGNHSSIPQWSAASIGADGALNALRRWKPDLIFGHGIDNVQLEAKTLQLAPSVFFVHNYYGTCISGTKTFQSPLPTACSRRFGWSCLLHYYPRRCGGLNPGTMVHLFQVQRERLALLSQYHAVVMQSQHMYREYVKHGVAVDRLHQLDYLSPAPAQGLPDTTAQESLGFPIRIVPTAETASTLQRDAGVVTLRLTFVGRMDALKGGSLLIEALPAVAVALKRPLYVTFVGDGPSRAEWQRMADHVQTSVRNVAIEFRGWLSKSQVEAVFEKTDLVVVPSIWPEPLGLVGIEAGRHGIPVAAFAVGGVIEWLLDGINGYLASGDPPTAPGLARAIIECLREPMLYGRLRKGALEVASRFSRANHCTQLLRVFQSTLDRSCSNEVHSCDLPVADS